MDEGRVFITDKEVCFLLGTSQSTLTKLMGGFHRGKISHNGVEVDLRDAKPLLVGGYRRWNVAKLADVLGLTKEQILTAVG